MGCLALLSLESPPQRFDATKSVLYSNPSPRYLHRTGSLSHCRQHCAETVLSSVGCHCCWLLGSIFQTKPCLYHLCFFDSYVRDIYYVLGTVLSVLQILTWQFLFFAWHISVYVCEHTHTVQMWPLVTFPLLLLCSVSFVETEFRVAQGVSEQGQRWPWPHPPDSV